MIDKRVVLTQDDVNLFRMMLQEKHFFEAHEVLEAHWFAYRFLESDEVKFLKGCINAAVSLELQKRGRLLQSKRVWLTYLKYRQLLFRLEASNQNLLYQISREIDRAGFRLVEHESL